MENKINNLMAKLPKKTNNRVYAKVTKVSSSGMQRHITFYVIKNNELNNITKELAEVGGFSFKGYNLGLAVKGCGMDMVFNVIYETNRAIASHQKKKMEHGKLCNYIINSHYNSI